MTNRTADDYLTEQQRRRVFADMIGAIDKHFFLPNTPKPDVRSFRMEHEEAAVRAPDRETFESVIQHALRTLASHHLGFFHARRARTSATAALAARVLPTNTQTDGSRWRFQSVQTGGPAEQAGIAAGDLLLTLEGTDIVAPQRMFLEHGRSYSARIRKRNGLVIETVIAIPLITQRRKAPPVITPSSPVTVKELDADTGLIQISSFPGVVGVDVSRDITRAVRELSRPRLIWDLRGNTGGGMGALRMMGHLCPDQRGVGYSVSRSLLERGYRKEALPRFDRIPASKIGLMPVVAKYAYWILTRQAHAIALFTEGLGHQEHHGRTAILIDQGSASAAEMVAAFAAEEKIATLVGTRTPGHLVSSGIRKLSFDYRLMLPTGGYMTWQGRMLEPGNGVIPDIDVAIDPDSVLTDQDNQLAQARAALSN